MSESRTITVEIEVEVSCRTETFIDGTDADGKRGWPVHELVPTNVEVLTRVPEAVADWAKDEAWRIFQERYTD